PTPHQLSASQLEQKQAQAAAKTASCIKSVKNQWDPVIKMAASENLPVSSYESDEQQLINKC
ncbi:MAG TPA: hypothetical protein VMS08_03400, partial [Candidatus Saccharimonadia bacterium]|nr:hypothetical protein [Candidatus Saccharimonadia bacterium]